MPLIPKILYSVVRILPIVTGALSFQIVIDFALAFSGQ
jgi:hypothetical protein